MAWQKPKTDWIRNDAINIIDYARITGNITSLANMCNEFFGNTIDLNPMDAKSNYTDIPYARNINDIEINVDKINDGSFKFDIGDIKIFFDNGNYIEADELNRIEDALLLIYKSLVVQQSIAQHLAFTLGGNKPFGARVHYATDETIAHRFEFNLGQPNGGIRV